MTSPNAPQAWLESPGGEHIALKGNCSMGRSSDNQVVVASERASRRHALIHAQEAEEYWLVDLGSSNGTFLNDRRVTQPTRLKDGDRIQVANISYAFRQNAVSAAEEEAALSQMTVVDLRNEDCWLLIADVANYTPLSQRLPADDLAALMGRWFRMVKELVERHGGAINKYLGDGLIVYWRGGASVAAKVAQAAQELRQAQQASDIEFRLVLHFGRVAMGGAGAMNEDSLMGPEVSFTFRVEKAAAGLGVGFCLSEAAQKHLASQLSLQAVPGEHPLKGFPGAYRFYALP